VTILPAAGCPTNCISIYASNIVAYTCGVCTNVLFNVSAVDTCCPVGANLTFNPPVTTCFPVNSSTPVTVTATDQCGNSATATFTVTILPAGGCAPTNCIFLYYSNVVAYTCASCTNVAYNVTAADYCCSNVVLTFNPPPTTCFPLNTTTPVKVTATDQCGNTNSAFFTVTVLPAAGCAPTNCLSLSTSNIVVYTCSNCTTVPFNGVASDPCCTVSAPTIIYKPPVTTCFPLNTTTPVEADAFDSCGHGATNIFLVTVLPAAGCGGSNPLSITGGSGPGGVTNTTLITLYWSAPNVQLWESDAMIEWRLVAAGSPYVVPNKGAMKFYRLLPK
jgi:hypothetical protein